MLKMDTKMPGKLICGMVALVILGLFVCVVDAAPGSVKRSKIGIFHEKGFPSKSPRPVAWYKEVLAAEGLNVTIIGVKEVCDTKALSRARFDTLILATGGYLPIDSEYAIGTFMNGGGNVVIDENMMISRWRPPAKVATEHDRLRKDFLQGKNIDEYRDFVQAHGLRQNHGGSLFQYSEKLDRWITPIEIFSYQTQGTPQYFQEFGLEPWPNHGEPAASYYLRPFSDDLKRNQALADAGLLEGMPQILPTRIATDMVKAVVPLPGFPPTIPVVKASSGREDGMMRFRLAGERDYYRAVPYAYPNDLLLPVYVFDKVSGGAYPGFPKAGKQAKDRDSDFYIYRSHSPLKVKGGSTLVHFGVAGAHLLKSDRGKEVLICALRLAESILPGERSPEFIETCNTFENELMAFYGKSIEARETLMKVAALHHYRGERQEQDEALRLLREQERVFKEVSNTGERLRAMALETRPIGHKNRLDLIRTCLRSAKDLERMRLKYEAVLLEHCEPPKPVPVENRFKRMSWGFANIVPRGITRLAGLYPAMKKIGMSLGPYYHQSAGGFHRAKELFEQTGISTGYRMSYTTSGHPAQRAFDMGILDPKTGTVETRKRSWFETPKDWEFYEKDAGWFLREVSKRPGISHVMFLGERNFNWNLWGERMEKRFRKYLKRKYLTIDALNERWDTRHKEFDDIVLPVKRPESRPEHALWEDWTRYREIYRMEEEVLPQAELVKKYAPNLFPLTYGSYHRHGDYPANGINFYELGKAFNPTGLEMGPGLKKEVLTADIAGFFHRNLTSEWSAFYFPPSARLEKINLLKEQLWNGVAWGQIGVHTFMGSIACQQYRNLIDPYNRILPVGWQLREVDRDFQKFDHIILDGQRVEPPIRILYSPTTLRHTSWPGIEGDKSLESVVGYYGAFLANHTPARAIDEGAILEGHLPSACRLLIIPQVTYLNDALLPRIEEFVRRGGTILITPDSGRFNQYGEELNSLMALAGVAPVTVKDSTVSLDEGKSLPFVTYKKAARSLSALFPEETDVVLRFKDGQPAVTRSRCGKGSVIVSGVPFGRSYYGEWKGAAGVALPFLNAVLDAAGIEREYSCSDREIVVRPWQYEGTRYLVLASRTRKGLVRKVSPDGGFPFRRQPLMAPFTLRIRGKWRVKDYLLGVELPAESDGQFTVVSGLIPAPGGGVYELQGAEKQTLATSPAKMPLPTGPPLVTARKKHLTLPFRGRLFAESGQIMLGDYRLSMNVDARGGVWGGDFYLQVSHRGEKIRKLCRAAETIEFPFLKKKLNVVCQHVSAVMPVSIEAAFTEEARAPIRHDCVLREETWLGQKSIVLQNGYLTVRILPGLGGRIIQFISRVDEANHMFSNERLIAQGSGDTWVDFGGMEENAGSWPGYFWDAPFEYKITKNSPDELEVVLLRTKSQKNKPYALEKVYTLKKGLVKLMVRNRMFNGREGKDSLKLRTHPAMSVGGDVSPSDTFFYPIGQAAKAVSYSANRDQAFSNEGAWLAVFDRDRKKGVVQEFARERVGELYMYMGKDSYNFEATTVPHEVAPGAYLEFDYGLGILQGMSGISGFGKDVGVNIVLDGGGVYGSNSDLGFTIEIGSLSPVAVAVTVSIESEKGKTADVPGFILELAPESPGIRSLKWNTGDLPDGKYFVSVRCRDTAKSEIVTARKQFALAGQKQELLSKRLAGFRKELEKAKGLYARDRNVKLKQRISRSAILLHRLEEAIQKNETGKVKEWMGLLEALLEDNQSDRGGRK